MTKHAAVRGTTGHWPTPDDWCLASARLYATVAEAEADLEALAGPGERPLILPVDEVPDGACALCAWYVRQQRNAE